MTNGRVEIEKALKAARDARNFAFDAKEEADWSVLATVSEAHELLVKAEGLLAQARYFASEEAKAE